MQASEPKEPKQIKLNRATRRRLGMIKKPTATQVLYAHFNEQRLAVCISMEFLKETPIAVCRTIQTLRNRQKRIRQGR